MTPEELHEFKQAHRTRAADVIRIALFAAALILLIFFFHLSLFMWALACWLLIAVVVVALMAGARSGDDMAEQVLRARRQELKAREDTRPYANVSRINGGGS